MPERHPGPAGLTRLRGRRTECAVLDELLAAVRLGESRTLVVLGEAGVGKSSLLEYAEESAAGLHLLRAAGVESEMELAFATLHQLCSPVLDHLDRLPGPQRDALRTVFGLSAGPPPDRFLVGLAVLTLLSEVAEVGGPLLCCVDDAQWLDQASAATLAFVARRLHTESVGLLFAAREPDDALRGLPALEVHGLDTGDARALLSTVVRFMLDEGVRDRIVAETHGNPLALLELPRDMTPTQLAVGFGVIGGPSLPGRIEASFQRRIEALPPDARSLLLVAAAEPVGDPLLVWRAAERLGVGSTAAVTASSEDLLTIKDRVTFRHPLVRSAVYRSAPAELRRAAHLALAEATDRAADPDRRAWHLAVAAPGPDEAVAAELEQSAGRARARGGLSAAAALLQRSVALSLDPARRADRALLAAQMSLQAGEFDEALGLLTTAEAGTLDELQQAKVDLLRGQVAFASSVGSDSPPLLLAAARRLEGIDAELARETYLDAWGAALFAGSLATSGGLLDVSRAARTAPRPVRPPRPADLLLDGLATLITDGRAAAVDALRQATSAFAVNQVSAEDNFRWGWLTTVPANLLWDEDSWHEINARQLRFAREAGALARLPIDLTASAVLMVWRGELSRAAAVIAEADAVTEATQTRIAPYGAMLLAAFRGRASEAIPLIEAAAAAATGGGQGIGVQYAAWAAAILDNGLGRYEKAFTAAEPASRESPALFLSAWALPELVEACARSGRTRLGADALERLAEATTAAGSDWALGIGARSQALLSTDDVADGLYREAIDRLGRTRIRPELARAQLVYGEWLRRAGRRILAREQLRAAYDSFVGIGMEAFADRARRELLATGEKVRKRTVEAPDDLTAQEQQIAALARDGLSNPEIGARLFISPRTVEWHLRKVFDKLGITSRKALQDVLPGPGRESSIA